MTIRLEDDVDVSRGDMIVSDDDGPVELREAEADVCWMSERPAEARLALQAQAHLAHGPRADRVDRGPHRREHDAEHADAEELALNDIGQVKLRLGQPVFCDPYDRNRDTGSFILIDEATNDTVGAGMVL